MVQTVSTEHGATLFPDSGSGGGIGEPRPDGDRGPTPGPGIAGKRIHEFIIGRATDDAARNTAGDAGDAAAAKTPRPRRRHGAASDAVGELIFESLGALNGILEVARGPHWKIPDAKTRRVANAYAKVIEVYLPIAKVGEMSVIIAAAVATLSAYGPPLTVDAMRAMEAAAKYRAAQQAAQQAAQRTPRPAYNPAGQSPGYMPPSYQSDPFASPAPEPAVTGEVVPPYADGIPNDMLRAMGINPDDPMVQAAMATAEKMMQGMFGANGGEA